LGDLVARVGEAIDRGHAVVLSYDSEASLPCIICDSPTDPDWIVRLLTSSHTAS